MSHAVIGEQGVSYVSVQNDAATAQPRRRSSIDRLPLTTYKSTATVVYMAPKSDLLQGTLDLLILRTLSGEPMHGWGISQRIQQVSKDVLQVNQGSLYPALHRLEQQGLVEAEWGTSENNRQAKFYQLTREGRKQLAEETRNWERLAGAVGRVLAGL